MKNNHVFVTFLTFQNKLQHEDTHHQSVTQASVELITTKIRQTRNSGQFNLYDWRRELSSETREVSDEVLRRSMAYGHTPGEVTTVLMALAKKDRAETDQNRGQARPKTSCGQIFGPLNDLREKLQQAGVPSLFQEILRIEEKEIDVSLQAFSSSHRSLRIFFQLLIDECLLISLSFSLEST